MQVSCISIELQWKNHQLIFIEGDILQPSFLRLAWCHLMKNQWNWYKPSVEEYLCLPNSSAELFETITKIKRAQIILQHEHHSFDRKHIGTDWKIYLLSSLLFTFLFCWGFCLRIRFGGLMLQWLLNYWGEKYMLMRFWIQKNVSIYTCFWVQPLHSDQGPKEFQRQWIGEGLFRLFRYWFLH